MALWEVILLLLPTYAAPLGTTQSPDPTAALPAPVVTWGSWGDWTPCSTDCSGFGLQQRSRDCGGDSCNGPGEEYKVCDRRNRKCRDERECRSIARNDDFNATLSVVVIRKVNRDRCLGVLVNRFLVVTSQTCVPGNARVNKITVRLLKEPGRTVKSIGILGMEYGITQITLESNLLNDDFKPDHSKTFSDLQEALMTKASQLPRLSFLNPKKVLSFCLLPVSASIDDINDKKGMPAKLVKFKKCGLKNDKELLCLEGKRPLVPFPRFYRGLPIFAESGGRIYVIGLLEGSVGSFMYMRRLDIVHDAIGCAEDFPGIWSEWFDFSDPRPKRCETESWWKDKPVCGREAPICLDYSVRAVFSDISNRQVPASCPVNQTVTASVETGLKCCTQQQPDGCYCHDYQVRFKCPYLIH